MKDLLLQVILFIYLISYSTTLSLSIKSDLRQGLTDKIISEYLLLSYYELTNSVIIANKEDKIKLSILKSNYSELIKLKETPNDIKTRVESKYNKYNKNKKLITKFQKAKDLLIRNLFTILDQVKLHMEKSMQDIENRIYMFLDNNFTEKELYTIRHQIDDNKVDEADN